MGDLPKEKSMADEVYRQQKKGETPEQNQTNLDKMAEIRQAAEAGNDEGVAAPGGQPQGPQSSAPLQPGGFEITGQPPAEFLERMKQGTQQQPPVAQQSTPQPQPQPQQPAANPMSRMNPEPQLRVTGSSKLEGLIEEASKSTGIYEEITLPSLGKFYDGSNGPKDGRIHVRPMTGEEEEILATPRFHKKGQAMNMIFNRCMRGNYDVSNWLSADRTYLLIYLRGISYTSDYDVEIKCPECDRRFATAIPLYDLDVENCPDNFNEETLSDELPRTKFKFNYRLSRGNDEQVVQDHADKMMKEFGDIDRPDDTLLFRTALLLNDIEGLTNKTELQVLLRKLPIEDVNYLRNTVNNPPFGVETTVEIVCKACQRDFAIELPLEAGFFFPQNRKKS